jgi:anti-sigma B factor antagonist
MNTPSAKLLVLVGEKFSCIKIVGRANFNSSVDFKTLVSELQQKGYSYFVLDLSECLLMDSTFLGVLTGFGLKLGQGNNPRITDLLENLGVLHLFKLSSGPLKAPEGAEVRAHTPLNPSKEEVTRACLEAHRTLMEANPENVGRFKEVTQFLAEDLKHLKAKA